MMLSTLLSSLFCVCLANLQFHLVDDNIVDSILNLHGYEVKPFADEDIPFHYNFNIPIDDDAFKDMLLFVETGESKKESKSDGTILLSEGREAGNFKTTRESPIVCETVCKPLAQEGADIDTKPNSAISFLQIEEKICGAKGGGWNAKLNECDHFLRASSKMTQYDPSSIFTACTDEFDLNYIPCNPYQALALSHLYEIGEHSYYWLWPGGNSIQGGNSVAKQEVGHNPASGMDKCSDDHHVGFFHNWGEGHVDSWGCLPNNSNLQVLCCRRS